MPRTPVKKQGRVKKRPKTIISDIASNPSIFTVEAGSHASNSFGFEIFKSSDPNKLVNPKKVHTQAGFKDISLAVNALINFMSNVIKVDGTKFTASHQTALTRKTTGATSYSIHLRDIMQKVQ